MTDAQNKAGADNKTEARSWNDVQKWLSERAVTEVECLVPDLTGIARGKILPAGKFIQSLQDRGLRLPENLFAQTVTGDFVEASGTNEIEPDIYLQPDLSTMRLVPWYEEPTAQVICDAYYRTEKPVPFAPRHVLRRVLGYFERKNWRPVMAPELEFFLVAKNVDPDLPLKPPIGRSGRPESGRQSYGIDAVNEFDPIFEDVYDFCEAQELEIDTLIHEAGAAQVEINFRHGSPLEMADQTFLFKRTVRVTALKHDVYATFMAKPYQNEPGSAMHIHVSLGSTKREGNLFATKDGRDTKLFLSFIAGLQKYLPAAMPLVAPNINSYRRLSRYWAAPINLHWGPENRTAGLRVPDSSRENRRIENRVPGADANPYLVMAATLACGYLGMVQKLEPTRPLLTSAYEKPYQLPRYLPDALETLKRCKPLIEILGPEFVSILVDVKNAEIEAYQEVISAWEREHLLLNV